VCGVAFCAEGAVTNEPKCNSAATCVIPAPQSCDPYQCDPAGSGCATSCQLDSECATGLVCINGGCTQPTPDGGVVDAGTRRDASTGTGTGTGGKGGASSTTDSGMTAAGGQIGTGAGGGPSGSSGAGGSRPGRGGSAGTSVDAGLSTGGPDAGQKPAESHDDSGCGCRTAGSSQAEGGASGIAGALAGLLLLAGRRRRSERPSA
jgi:hypothetical protein